MINLTNEGAHMTISYKKLWKLLIDKDMNKQDLRQKTGLCAATMARLSKGENVSTESLLRICEALDCEVGDVLEYVPDNRR